MAIKMSHAIAFKNGSCLRLRTLVIDSDQEYLVDVVASYKYYIPISVLHNYVTI